MPRGSLAQLIHEHFRVDSLAAVHLDASLDLACGVLIDVMDSPLNHDEELRVCQGRHSFARFAFLRTAVLWAACGSQQQKTAVFTDVDGIATP